MGNAESYDAQRRRRRRRFREAFFSDESEVISADGARTVNAGEDVAIAPQLSERRKQRVNAWLLSPRMLPPTSSSLLPFLFLVPQVDFFHIRQDISHY